MDRERAKARERQAQRLATLSLDPAWVEKERERQRISRQAWRKNPDNNEKHKELAKASRAKPENKAKQSERMSIWREENAGHIKKYKSAWQEENSAHIANYSKQYMAEYLIRDDVKLSIWKRGLWKNYRMTVEEFNVMWSEQSGKCAICHVDLSPRGREKSSACVDHNHETGAVRGLLCRACNHGIGQLCDDTKILQSAISYLESRGSYAKSQSKEIDNV